MHAVIATSLEAAQGWSASAVERLRPYEKFFLMSPKSIIGIQTGTEAGSGWPRRRVSEISFLTSRTIFEVVRKQPFDSLEPNESRDYVYLNFQDLLQ